MSHTSTRVRRLSTLITAVLGIVLAAHSAHAVERWSEGCTMCHDFLVSPYVSDSGHTWPDSLHEVHRDSAYMGSACALCHSESDSNDPYLSSSDGTANNSGWGCMGCHGHVEGTAPSGSGLLAQHRGRGIGCGESMDCHLGEPTPPPESALPAYYITADNNVSYPCNTDPESSEDFSGDEMGIDNDGDGQLDGDDPDCMAPLCGDGNVDDPETCDPPGSCPADCGERDGCSTYVLDGSPEECTAKCVAEITTACADDDGCCAAGCDETTDNDCELDTIKDTDSDSDASSDADSDTESDGSVVPDSLSVVAGGCTCSVGQSRSRPWAPIVALTLPLLVLFRRRRR